MQQSPNFWRIHFGKIILGLFIIFYLVNGINYLQQQSITSDEGSFMDYAIRYLKGRPERVHPVTDNSKMPITLLNTLPRVIDEMIIGETNKNDGGISDTIHGRYITLFISIFTIILVYVWSSQLYGKIAGLFSSLLASLCPNSLAHAGLVTTDSYAALFLLASMFFLWKFCRVRTTRYFLLCCTFVAVSQLVKQSLFHLYIIVPICLLVYFNVYRERTNWGLFFRRLLLFVMITILVINAGYYFTGSFRTLGSYQFMSQLFQGVQQTFPSWTPMPFPSPFTEGLDMAKYYDQVGGGIDGRSSFGKPTILGKASTAGSFWYYYFVSLFYKTPIPYLVFFLWGIINIARDRTRKTFVAHEFFLLAPVVYFLVLMSFFYQTQCGLRHIIFIYPFLFILAGAVIVKLKRALNRIVIGLLLVWLMFSVFRYWGNYYPYTNEFIPVKKNAVNVVGSANLEFHQGYYFATDYMDKHPGVIWAPKEHAVGKFIISTEDYEDVWNRHEYDWIRSIEPSGHVAYNYLLIEVTENDLKKTGEIQK